MIGAAHLYICETPQPLSKSTTFQHLIAAQTLLRCSQAASGSNLGRTMQVSPSTHCAAQLFGIMEESWMGFSDWMPMNTINVSPALLLISKLRTLYHAEEVVA